MWNNWISSAAFYFIAVIAIVFSILTVTLKNIFHSAISLIVVLFSVAAVYIYLDAEFLALVQILIYVGAIATLIIFAIMLTAKISDKAIKQNNEQKLVSFFVALSLGAIFIFIFSKAGSRISLSSFNSPALADTGKQLLTTYALPFELISLILLAAIIGAITISRKE